MELRLPKTIHDLRVKHVKILRNDDYLALMDKSTNDAEYINLCISYVADFAGVDKMLLRQQPLEHVLKAYAHCAGLFAKIPKFDPKKELIINGKAYEMVNPRTVATGWHIDWGRGMEKDDNGKNILDKDPVRVACLLYVPKGSNYSELDSTGNLKDKIADRYKDFDEHFPLIEFINVTGFFLLKYQRLIEKRLTQIKTQNRVQKMLNRVGINGRK